MYLQSQKSLLLFDSATGMNYIDTKYIYTLPCPVRRPLIVTEDVDNKPIFIFSSSSLEPIANISKTVLQAIGKVIIPMSRRLDHWTTLLPTYNNYSTMS